MRRLHKKRHVSLHLWFFINHSLNVPYSDQEKAATRPALSTQDPNRPTGTDQMTRTVQELQADARRNAMIARTLPKGTAKSGAGSGSLQAAVAKGTPRQINVYLVPVVSTGTRTEASRILANATRAFPEDILMNGKLNVLSHGGLELSTL